MLSIPLWLQDPCWRTLVSLPATLASYILSINHFTGRVHAQSYHLIMWSLPRGSPCVMGCFKSDYRSNRIRDLVGQFHRKHFRNPGWRHNIKIVSPLLLFVNVPLGADSSHNDFVSLLLMWTICWPSIQNVAGNYEVRIRWHRDAITSENRKMNTSRIFINFYRITNSGTV